MKILVIHNILWAHYKNVLFEEIQKQLPVPHEFHVLQIAKNEISRKKMEAGFQTYNYNFTLLFDDYIENVPKVREIIDVIRFFFKYNPDIINVTGYSANVSTLPLIFLAKLMGKKVVMSNESTYSDKERAGIKEILKKAAVKACSGFLVFGKTSEKYLLKLGARSGDIFVKKGAVVDNSAIGKIYNSANSKTLFPEIKTHKNFIFAGRISPEKNVDLLVQAFQHLVKTYSNWGLIIIGNGSNDQTVKDLINDAPANIYKYDAVGWQKIPEFFTKADTLVLPSSSEPWGLIVNEAMVCGLSVIVSDVSGCVEDLVKDNGFKVKTNSLESLIEAMELTIKSSDLDRMKLRSKEIIREFSPERVAAEYVSGITKL